MSKANESPDEEGPATFYIYTSVGNQSVVFKRNWDEVSPPEQGDDLSSDEHSDRLSDDSAIKTTSEQQAHLEAEDMMRQITEEVKQEG